MDSMNTPVIEERERRGWSRRYAAEQGGISNTAWSKFEQTGHLTPRMKRAVAQAFGWATTWPETGGETL